MLSRSMTQSTSIRAGAIRRQRRRALAATTDRIFCSTNGCPSFLELDTAAGVAVCPVCGSRRRLS